MPIPLTLGKIAELLDGQLLGDSEIPIHGVLPIEYAKPGYLTWLSAKSHEKRLADCPASAVLCAPGLNFGDKPAIVCEHTDLALIRVLKEFMPDRGLPKAGIHASAVIEDAVSIGRDVAIGPGVVVQSGVRIGDRTVLHANSFVGRDCSIGDDCVVWPNVVILDRCSIGNRVTIHPNATLGADGFGYAFSQGKFEKIPHIGIVRIEDDVEIGAGTCIDRAKSHETVIGQGTKIDNLVQVAHNVNVGSHSCLCAQVGIAGSAEVGDHVMLGGKVGVKDNIRLGDRIKVLAYSAVAGNLASDRNYLGIPAEPQEEHFERMRVARKLPAFMQQVKSLFDKISHYENLLQSATGKSKENT